MCDCPTVYVQKDFNRTMGVSIFVARAILFLICAWYNRLVEGTICYKRYAQYRDFAPEPKNRGFELELAEKFDPLDKRTGAENPAAAWKGR